MFRFDFPYWIDPVIFSIGPIQLTWYALAYMGGLIAAWYIVRKRVAADGFSLRPTDIDDFVVYALLGVILGGRIGNFLLGWGHGSFSEQLAAMFWPLQTLPDGSRVFAISGMSFHGGFLGVVLAALIFWWRKRHAFPLMGLADYLALVAPIGLFFGRLANFINRELYGRIVGENAVFGINFYPEGNPAYLQSRLDGCLETSEGFANQCREFFDLTAYRHPSQLYEAAGEGILLSALLWALYANPFIRARKGFITGAFIAGYGLIRTLVEFVRSYEPSLGLNVLGFNRSQELSLPMIAIGILVMIWAARRMRNDKPA